MSTTILQVTFSVGGVLTDATTALLSDAGGTYGIKRNDTDAVVVADGTALTNVATGTYTYSFEDPASALTYTYAVEFVYGGVTYRESGDLTGGTATATAATVGTEINLYATLSQYKRSLGIASTDNDQRILECLERASRWCDDETHRYFYTVAATKYFDARAVYDLLLDEDVLAITTLTADSEEDGTFDGETWVANTDYVLLPDNKWPKTNLLVLDYGNYSLTTRRRYLKVIGTFGFGDGESATPWRASGITITVGTAGGTTVTASATGLEAGMTIRAGTEDLYISAVATDGVTLTCRRGVNGSTAAAQSAAAASIALYPKAVTNATILKAAEYYVDPERVGMESEWMGTYGYRTRKPGDQTDVDRRMLGFYTRTRAA